MRHPNIIFFRKAFLTIGVLTGLGLAASTRAQETPEAPVAQKPLPPVQIDSAPLEYRQFDKVELTGSSIVRKEQTQALPVHVFTRDDIKRSGLTNLVDVLFSLPTMSMVVSSSAMSTTIGGYNATSMRGMPGQTLVLLNGLRLAPFGRQTVIGVDRPGVEIETIPLSAVDRIEILSDGASSLYGSDAVAGVINIITRTEQKGLEIAIEKKGTTQGGGAGHQITLNGGWGRLNADGYSIRWSAELGRQDALQGLDRPQYSQGRYSVARDGQNYVIDGGKVSYYTMPGTFYMPGNAATGQPSRFFNTLYQNGQCPNAYVQVLGQPSCKDGGYQGSTIYPQQESRKLFISGETLLDGGAKAYAEVLYTQLNMGNFATQNWRQLAYSIGKTPDSVGYQEAINAGMDPAKTYFLWSPTGLDDPKREYVQKNWRVASGVKGEWREWDYHLNAYWAQSNVARWLEDIDYVSNGLVTGKTLTDPSMLKPLTTDNPLTAILNGLRNQYSLWDRGRIDYKVANLRASRALMEIDGKDVLLGTGLEWRRESTDYSYETNTETQTSFKAQRDVKAGYLELQIPVTHRWDVMASARLDDYSDVGESINTKLASRFDVGQGWAIRGSVGTGFRAPPLGQLQKFDKLYSAGQTSFVNDCSNAMLQVLASLKASLCYREKMTVYGNGNPDLKPELSTQQTLGISFRPSGNFYITADWWQINLRDKISTLDPATILSDPLAYSKYIFIGPDKRPALSAPNYNIGRSEKSGIDVDMRWRKPTEWGQWNMLVQGAYNLNSKDRFGQDKPFVSDLGRYNPVTDTITPRLRMRWTAGVSNAVWSLHGTLNYTSGYDEADMTGVNVVTGQSQLLTGFRVPAFKTFDLNATFAPMPAVTVRATVGNIFNAQAPQSFTSTSTAVFGFNTRDHSLWGRTFSVGLSAKF
jgi:iron complex outermembrane receptor protein